MEPFPYTPGYETTNNLPLQRFLPPIPQGMLANWGSRIDPSAGWLIDPFGSYPMVPIELANEGFNIIVICNNPILQFMLQVLAAAPQKSDFVSALAEFAKERRNDERLESHLQSLYETECPNCNQTIHAQSFIWKRDSSQPVSKIIKCKTCNAEGEFPINDNDIARLQQIGSDPLHRARALQRVNINPDVIAGAQDVIQSYLARPLYFLTTLINRVERLQADDQTKKLLLALALSALDEGNSLWAWPSSRTRPKQLSTPPQFRENNLWYTLENAIDVWCVNDKPTPLSIWPEIPQEQGSICLYNGRLASFQSDIHTENVMFSAAVFSLPRPNQAFWSLSALWSGWIWGRDAVFPMKGALERRRFDWYWYSTALHQTLCKLRSLLKIDKQIFGIISEIEIGFITGTLTAADSAGFHLTSMAIRADDDIAQCIWDAKKTDLQASKRDIVSQCKQAAATYLHQRNEPAEKLLIFACCMADIVHSGSIPTTKNTLPYFTIKEYQNKIPAFLADPLQFTSDIVHVGQQENQILWLKNLREKTAPTLADRIEKSIYEQLAQSGPISKHALDREVCKQFPGLLTPSNEWITTCLETYALPDKTYPTLWRIREKESPRNREIDLQDIKQKLVKIGSNLGYQIEEGVFINWLIKGQNIPDYEFLVQTSSIFSEYVFAQPSYTAQNRILVLPGSHAKILISKLQNNPRLSQAVNQQWRVIKYRLVNLLEQEQKITIEIFNQMLDSDPPKSEEPTQISIL